MWICLQPIAPHINKKSYYFLTLALKQILTFVAIEFGF